MISSLRDSTYGVMSKSHFCDANSAVQITSDEKMSHSPDFASWRWTNWARCSSAEVENSTSFTVTPLPCALKSLMACLMSPDVSLPMQTVTLPLALSIDLGSMAFEPSVLPVSLELAPPLLPPPESSSPQAATPPASTTHANSAATNFLSHLTCGALLRWFRGPRGPWSSYPYLAPV